jgi:hypothetical protein
MRVRMSSSVSRRLAWWRPCAAGHAGPRWARASATLGALIELGGYVIRQVVDTVDSRDPVYVAVGWARLYGWTEIKRTITGIDTIPVAEPGVTAVGAALLVAAAFDWTTDAVTTLYGA